MWKCEECGTVCDDWEEFCEVCASTSCRLCGRVHLMHVGCQCQKEDED